MKNLLYLLNRLEQAHIHYKLSKVNDESIMVEVAVPGQRWEIEFLDGGVRTEKFLSDGTIYADSEIDILFRNFSD